MPYKEFVQIFKKKYLLTFIS